MQVLHIDVLKTMPQGGKDVLQHYGRLKAVRDVGCETFGSLGERSDAVFGSAESKFLREVSLPLSVDPAGFGIKLAQSLLVTVQGKRIGHPTHGTLPCLYLVVSMQRCGGRERSNK